MVGCGLHNLHGLHVGARVALDVAAIKTWIGVSVMSRACLGGTSGHSSDHQILIEVEDLQKMKRQINPKVEAEWRKEKTRCRNV